MNLPLLTNLYHLTMHEKINFPRIINFSSVDSTNKKAKELLKDGILPEETIIIAESQSAGKGYGSNTWESAPGENLTLSYILYPSFLAPHLQFWLTRVLSLAVADTIKHYITIKKSIKIKWPNDIYADQDKIAGILVENTIMGEIIRDSICGIGLNINQVVFKSDAPNPVSLRLITKEHYNLTDVLATLRLRLNYRYTKLKNNDFDSLESEYHQSLYRLGQESKFRSKEGIFTGVITGTDEYGRLMIEASEGTKYFDFKEVAFL
jgi:BirA family transcriptional regulator, biotin operon repressor / biotin---[acetyl-CoA-carboxylase] ligase